MFCRHRNMSRPITLGNRCYDVCLDCGRERDRTDWNLQRAFTRTQEAKPQNKQVTGIERTVDEQFLRERGVMP